MDAGHTAIGLSADFMDEELQLTLPDEELVAAKVEEIDRAIADLQKRRSELLMAKEVPVSVPEAPPKMEAVAIKVPAKVERIPMTVPKRPQPAKPKNALEAALDELPWKSFKKKEGEWAFLRDREGRLIDELDSEREFVDRLRKEGGHRRSSCWGS
jgi:hypothetical protein